ncbi:MAG TPA: hypothetical protein VH280_15195, partial [Verrucomicrobiae bacterium]|nr:hypothetical protein [Verrucomicrobiae bacterium]
MTTANGQAFGGETVISPNATPFVFVSQINASNTGIQVVFINTNLPGISTDVRFEGGFGDLSTPVIQWTSLATNRNGVPTATNLLYVTDQFGSFPTNTLMTNSYTLSGVPVLSPYNYSFFRSFAGFTNLPGSNQSFDTQTLFANIGRVTNAYAALGINVADVSFAPDSTTGPASLTNFPGRISIVASNSLNLSRTKITGPNYISIAASNNFVGSSNATIIVPNMDIDVGSTTGLLQITNLVAPSVPRINGPIDLWSGRWTNTFMVGTNGPFTNTFHILIVDSGLAPTAPVSVLNFTARSTNQATGEPGNVVISDVLNITNSFLIEAENLTVTTNDASALNPTGEINFFNQTADFSVSLPILQNLTNFGVIDIPVNANFTRATPYTSFVNHGLIGGEGMSIFSDYVENTSLGVGIFQVGSVFLTNDSFGALLDGEDGTITVQAGTARLTNDSFLSLGDQTLTANNLTVIGHVFDTSGALTLSVSNSAVDGGAASSNFWTAANGINLLVKPMSGDFLGTTITLTSPAESEVDDTWAGLDLGATS